MKDNKEGLYAQYCKNTGCFLKTIIKKRSDIYKSNKDSQTYVSELLAENPELIHDYPFDIPQNIEKEDKFECDICNEYYFESDMYYIVQDDDDEHANQCNDCL